MGQGYRSGFFMPSIDKYTCQRYNNDNNTCQKKGGFIETS